MTMNERDIAEQSFNNGYAKGYADGKAKVMSEIAFPRLLVRQPELSKKDVEDILMQSPTIIMDKTEIIPIYPYRWIPVTERLPEPETEVLILARSKRYSFKGTVTTHHIVTTGMYEDGSKNTEDSEWCWYDHDFKYDEELDAYIIPEGWWEYKHYNGDDEHNHPIDNTVTHWMPLPEAPKGE